MSRKEDVKRMWIECFGDSPEYTDMYFDRVYNDADAMILQQDDKPVSSLLLQRYAMRFHGSDAAMGYIAGAVTRRNCRGRGFMSRLVTDAVRESYLRGDMLCALMPAHDWLYFFFDRFGFSTVFLSDTQRFTSLHSFPVQSAYYSLSDPYAPEIYEAFAAFERARAGGVLHSRRDFLNVLDDLAMREGGTFVAVGRADAPIAAMAWAMDAGSVVQFNELLGVDEDARTGAMRELRRRFPDRAFRYLAPATDCGHRHLYARGMGRIVNVRDCLTRIAAADGSWHSVIRISDPILPENNHVYVVSDGVCRINDSYRGHLDFDVPIHVFTRIVFSSESIADILVFPSQRTHMSLMLH